MTHPTDTCPVRLVNLSLPARITLTLFLALIGSGYLVAVYKIQVWHHDADGEPGMTLDDLRAVYHGLDKPVTQRVPSRMLRVVQPGGVMRRHLQKGGEPAVRALISWLEDGARAENFAQPEAYHPGDPSARDVIARRCVSCHRADGGDKEDLPYAPSESAGPRHDLVAKVAAPMIGSGTVHINPASVRDLVHVTHAHILSIPVFVLIVAALFLLTGLSARVKLILAPLPMVATCLDFASWWLARPLEPFVYVIAAAGAVFGATLGLQILCILGSMWFGSRLRG